MPKLPDGVDVYEGPRGKRYVIRYYVNGKQIEETTDAETAKEADEIRSRLMNDATDGRWLPKRERKARARVAAIVELAGAEPVDLSGPTFGKLLDEYEKKVAPLKRDKDWQALIVKTLRAELGDVPLVALTPERVETWIEKLRTERVERKSYGVEKHVNGKARWRRVETGSELVPRLSASTIRKFVFAGSGVYTSLLKSSDVRRRFGIRSNPFANQILPEEPTTVPRVMRAEDVESFLAACAGVNERLRRWALVLLALGCRVEEAMILDWRDVDLSSGAVDIRGKTGERSGALSPDGLAMFKTWHKDDGKPKRGPVLGYAYPSLPKKHWAAAFKRAGLAGRFTARNFRTTFCSRAFNGGARPEDLVAQTGHSLETLMSYYVRFERESKRRAIAAADFNLGALSAVGSKASPKGAAQGEIPSKTRKTTKTTKRTERPTSRKHS